jgi:hypothetical protein
MALLLVVEFLSLVVNELASGLAPFIKDLKNNWRLQLTPSDFLSILLGFLKRKSAFFIIIDDPRKKYFHSLL